ncbi:hypothetical protein GNI_004970 [Gregarina niphandrodes]|uniref:Uncharacterized protein n=1 Tax=Gregarina niphandrodes TaxID=110365 RepID=A0A023BDQ1_GRENI|nr:hypothetical protein GNI_004970 [Gregarina niphandrodes]EZG88355.1 hypothetical protein GNI_004970 [Gregarina niphandrodes]|eukprot:XP_011128582.1 hypothetical protein GNI_004970 [Gregarina niphandrodes]
MKHDFSFKHDESKALIGFELLDRITKKEFIGGHARVVIDELYKSGCLETLQNRMRACAMTVEEHLADRMQALLWLLGSVRSLLQLHVDALNSTQSASRVHREAEQKMEARIPLSEGGQDLDRHPLSREPFTQEPFSQGMDHRR